MHGLKRKSPVQSFVTLSRPRPSLELEAGVLCFCVYVLRRFNDTLFAGRPTHRTPITTTVYDDVSNFGAESKAPSSPRPRHASRSCRPRKQLLKLRWW